MSVVHCLNFAYITSISQNRSPQPLPLTYALTWGRIVFLLSFSISSFMKMDATLGAMFVGNLAAAV